MCMHIFARARVRVCVLVWMCIFICLFIDQKKKIKINASGKMPV